MGELSLEDLDEGRVGRGAAGTSAIGATVDRCSLLSQVHHSTGPNTEKGS